MSGENFNILSVVVQALILGATITYVILVYKTLRAGQRQANEANTLTKQNLAINQFEIYNDEFKSIIQLFEKLKFSVDFNLINCNPGRLNGTDFKNWVNQSNGIDYINAFHILTFRDYFLEESGSLNLYRLNEFRYNIIFPLVRHYIVLLNFLNRVKDDEILTVDYQKIFYLRVERDLLQHYLRICNNEFIPGTKWYDLSIFDTEVFDSKEFYVINKFYNNNKSFQMWSWNFYKENK